MYKSTNGGLNFNAVTNYCNEYNGTYTHSDIRTIEWINGNSTNSNEDVLFVGNDGGVLKTTNGGTNWTNINGTGLDITQFYGLGGTESDPGLIVAGSQDNSVMTYIDPTWNVYLGPLGTTGVGDAYDYAIDHDNSQIMFGAANGGTNRLYKSIDGGLTWGNMSQPSGVSLTDRPLLIDKNNIWYVGNHDVFASNNQGGTWIHLSDFTNDNGVSSGERLKAIAVAPSNTDYIYAAFAEPTWTWPQVPPVNKFFMTSNRGATWTDIGQSLYINSVYPICNAGISNIVVDPNNPLRIWVTFSNFWEEWGNPGYGIFRVVYGYYDSQSSSWIWSDYSEGLPQFPVLKIVYENGSNDGLYIGTDVGVYFRTASMPDWQCYSTNLPVGIVPDLEINYATNKIRASVFGRGLWESFLACPVEDFFVETQTYTQNTFLEAKDYITSTSTINSGLSVKYRAGNSITLLPGFTANLGSDFLAFIYPCDMNTNKKSSKADNRESFINKEKTGRPSFKITPNPNDGNFSVTYSTPEKSLGIFDIYDITGRLVFSTLLIGGENILPINISKFEGGVYFYNVVVDKKRIASDRIVIVK